MHLVSIIIPVYNMEKYLRRCLDSVVGQTLQNIEIICVNDGSTDNSLKIIEEYQKKDKRIKIISKVNGGLVSARKAGVKAAESQYIGYVDSDDWIEKDMFEKLYEYMEVNQADIVSSGYIFEGNYITKHFDNVTEGLYDEFTIGSLRDNIIYCTEKRDVGIRGSLCCKLFKKDLLMRAQNDISDEVSFSEDKLCIIAYLLNCKRVFVVKEAYYHYMLNQTSMVHKPDANYLVAVNEVYQQFIKFYQHPNFTDTMRMQAELYIVELLYKGINSRLGFKNKNLLWIDPYYLPALPQNSKIVLCGAGELGEVYYNQLLSRKDIEVVAILDTEFNIVKNLSSEFVLDDVRTYQNIFFLLTVKNEHKAISMKDELLKLGISGEKVLWYEQKEVYWKFADANGWI